MAAPQVLLSDYHASVRDLLHDPNDQFFSKAAKTRWINEGVRMRDILTKYNRVLKTFNTVIGTDNYSFTDFGDARVFDVIGVYVIYGQLRVVLDNVSFTMMNARVRQLQPLYRNVPICWARYGPNSIYIAPAPSMVFAMEADCARYSTTLVNDTDPDDLPYPYTDPVPYYAAYKAKLNERQNDEAAEFLDAFQMACAVATGERTGMLASAYPGGLIGARPS